MKTKTNQLRQINPYKIIVIFLQLCLSSYLSFGTVFAAHLTEKMPPQRHSYDFGPRRSAVKKLFTPVDQNSLYSNATGFGLLAESYESYDNTPDALYTDILAYDGISDQKEIRFRVDIDPGEYLIEIYMAGGQYNIWLGEIRVNGTLLVDSLRAYASSFEGEDPPPYWTFMKKVEIDDPACIIEIKAHNQPSTLAGLALYPSVPDKIKLLNGKLISHDKFESPNADFALRLINEGKIADAQRLIDPIPEELYSFEKASLLMALAGRLEVNNPRSYLEWASSLYKQVADESHIAAARLNLRLIELYLEADQWYKMAGWDWAAKLTRQGIFDRLDLAGFSFQKVASFSEHLLSQQSTFQLGKLTFWGYVEQHGEYKLQTARKCFSRLLPYYPDHKLLRIYAGERIPAKDINYDPSSGIPEWAFYTSQGLINIKETIHYWVDNRQAENGEFGGKYDDDVEILRWWPIARMATDDQKTLLGLKKLVDGIWHSPWITEGFSTKLRDVEHSSEPVADTQPMMIGLDYGNPVYVERCMKSIQRLNDLWTGINERGHRHFRSSWYSYKGIDERPPRDCDVPMNTRTIKALRWLAWYNQHPVAIRFMREWGDAWLEDCLRTDKQKPYGIVPAAVRYSDDALGGHADNWHHPEMFWSYFDFHGGADMLMQFLATYDLTGDERYLQPIELAIQLVRKYDRTINDNAEPGSEAWTARVLRSSNDFGEVVEKWRLITGRQEYDELLQRYGSDYLKFRLSGDYSYIIKGSRDVVDGIITNHELLTTEGYFTDRIEIGNMHINQVLGASHLESVYTGSSLSEGFYPFHAVTWQGFDENFAAIVSESSRDRIAIQAYNLGKNAKSGQLYFWRLAPGKYLFSQSNIMDADHTSEQIIEYDTVSVIGRGSSWALTLPPGVLQSIEVTLIQADSVERIPPRADLAITKLDLKILNNEYHEVILEVPVHNIGITNATDFNVELHSINGNQTKLIDTKHIALLESPLDLEPKIHIVEFPVKLPTDLKSEWLIVVDPENQVEEITEINNSLKIHPDELRY